MADSKAKSRGKESYESGVKLENRVARWLKSQFDYKVKKREFVNGDIAKRPYEVDIHGIKESMLGLMKNHLWVECKVYTVKRTHVTKLVESARDVEELNEKYEEKQSWKPDKLMLVSSKGFDTDALGMAKKYDIYCVKAGKTYDFVGCMSREDFEDGENSDY